MSKVTDAAIAAIKAKFENGDVPDGTDFVNLITAIQEAAQDHEHKAAGGSGSGTGDAGQVDHGSQLGLDDDDHKHYSLRDLADLTEDGQYDGHTVEGVAGAALVFGEPCYLAAADSRWELTKGDAVATSGGRIGVCVLAAEADGDATRILTWGKVRAALFPAFTVGAPAYLDAATAGRVVVAAPSGTEDFVVRAIGEASTEEDLMVDPDRLYVVLNGT